jgi:hypothetical protein
VQVTPSGRGVSIGGMARGARRLYLGRMIRPSSLLRRSPAGGRPPRVLPALLLLIGPLMTLLLFPVVLLLFLVFVAYERAREARVRRAG